MKKTVADLIALQVRTDIAQDRLEKALAAHIAKWEADPDYSYGEGFQAYKKRYETLSSRIFMLSAYRGRVVMELIHLMKEARSHDNA